MTLYPQGDDEDDIVCDETPVESSCEPDYGQGDNPCVVGCGHAPVPNPFNHNPREAKKEQRPGPCKNYRCLCADSGCARSWDEGCIKWYMQCQSATQVCGRLSDAPAAVQDFNIGASCAVAPISANTRVCFNEEMTAPSSSPVSMSQPGDYHDDNTGTGVAPGYADDHATGTGTGKKSGYVPSSSGGGGDDDDGSAGPEVVSGKKGGSGGYDDDGPSGPAGSGKKGGYGYDDVDHTGPSGGEDEDNTDTSGIGYGPSRSPVSMSQPEDDHDYNTITGVADGDDDDDDDASGTESGKKSGFVPSSSGDDDYDDGPAGPEVVSGKKDGYGGYDDDGPPGPGVESGKKGGDGYNDDTPSGPSGGEDDESTDSSHSQYGYDDQPKPRPPPVDAGSTNSTNSYGSGGKPIPGKPERTFTP
jgi:hypothetical protein